MKVEVSRFNATIFELVYPDKTVGSHVMKASSPSTVVPPLKVSA